ncbi:MAG: hypothetical protein KGY61_09360 [Desulfobacterales bacterium]|nr:hypothetical protein [Desulfobacterales bacterium]
MSRQVSFTKYERKILPDYRQRISSAESSQDVKKFFVYMVGMLFNEIFGEKITLEDNDIRLTPERSAGYQLSRELRANPELIETWRTSDLSDLLDRMAEVACNRYRHLEKHPEKTSSKIRK